MIQQDSANVDTFATLARLAFDGDGDGAISRFEAAAGAMRMVAESSDAEEANIDEVAVWLRQAAGTMVAAPGERAMGPGPAFILEVDATGRSIEISGVVDGSAPALFIEARLTEPRLEEVVIRNVTLVSDAGAGAELARLIAASGLSTRVPKDGKVAGHGLILATSSESRHFERGARVGELLMPADGGMPTMHWMTDKEISERGLRTEIDGLEIGNVGSSASLRGLCAVSVDIAWATGSQATVARTIDGGKTWKNVAPASIAGLDVRDVHALDQNEAWILTAGPGEASRILATKDGGRTWTEQVRETDPASFLDGFDFWDDQRAIAYGDPLGDGSFRVLVTMDGGETWTPAENGPAALAGGEAAFAASGTGIRAFDSQRACIVTGASDESARALFSLDMGKTWNAASVPIEAMKPAAGAFSLAVHTDGTAVAVGGDFQNRPKGGVSCAAWSDDFGETWHAPEKGPRGQRAGSAALRSGAFLCTGQTGTDISRDAGKTWLPFSSEGFHCVAVSAYDGTIWFAGPKGKVARLR